MSQYGPPSTPGPGSSPPTHSGEPVYPPNGYLAAPQAPRIQLAPGAHYDGVLVLLGVYMLATVLAVSATGYSLGKRLVGLRVVNQTTLCAPGFGSAFARGILLVPLTIFWPWGLLLLLSATVFDKTGRLQGWHDRAAQTLELDVRLGIDTVTSKGPFPLPVRLG